MWVKICGNTRLQDCLTAAELGADAVGFVFARGKRTVTPQEVAAITAKLPPELERIGVFTTLDLEEIVSAVQTAGLTGVQLHTGAPSFQLLASLRSHFGSAKRVSLVQVAHRWTDFTEEEQGAAFAETVHAIAQDEHADALLIDSKTRDSSGGTGQPFDWHTARPALAALRMRLIVAGGLRPDNVREAVRILQPWGVDVSSGVESAPGVKDAAKVKDFIQQARSEALAPDGVGGEA